MSSPAPVPSKAAIHALRGLLFGTSCSLVLLAEERRQRIKIARSAVENGRKIKSLKRYSTSGTAAVEALREEVRSDPNFISWSNRSRNRSSSHECGRLAFDTSSADYPLHDLGPDPRRPTRHAREAQDRDAGRGPPEETDTPRRQRQSHPDFLKYPSHDSTWGQRFNPPKIALRYVAGTSTLKSFFKRGSERDDGVASILDNVLSERPHLRPPDGQHAELPAPDAAVALMLRAYESTASSKELPPWFLQLSSLLCVACREGGHVDKAGHILQITVDHGPISLEHFMAHQPFELINQMVSHEEIQGLSEQALTDRVKLAAATYVADIAESRMEDALLQEFIAVGKTLITRALTLQRAMSIVGVFDRVKSLARAKLSDTTWFIKQLADHNENTLAVDVFIETYAGLKTSRESEVVANLVVKCATRARAYAALELMDTVLELSRRDGWQVRSSWVEGLIWLHWKCLKNYDETCKLIGHMLDNNFYGIAQTRRLDNRIIRVCLEAGDVGTARRHFHRIVSADPDARGDMEILGAFAMHKAYRGDWDGVRADFEGMQTMGPFHEAQKREFNSIFVDILQIHAQDHTWGEVETFLQTYVEQLGVGLDTNLVRFIADRHGRCRDLNAMARWLRYAIESGYRSDYRFWFTLFLSCRRDWKYTVDDMTELYRALVAHGIKESCPGIEKLFEEFGAALSSPLKLQRSRLTAHRFNPANEPTTFQRMKNEAFHRNWAAVRSIYNRAVHNNMGFSSRCLRLAVHAHVSLSGSTCIRAKDLLARAQSDGHDISNAIIPLVLAQLSEYLEVAQEEKESHHYRRGRPLPFLQSLLADLDRRGIHISDVVFNRAARVCLVQQNYKEAVHLCVSAAQANGGDDLCYSVGNFSTLLHVYTATHEYEKVRWLVEQCIERDWRFSRACRQALNWAVHYLEVASSVDKDEDLRESDREMLAIIKEVRDLVRKEHHDVKAEAQDRFLRALTGQGRPGAAAPADDDDSDSSCKDLSDAYYDDECSDEEKENDVRSVESAF
ncbi:hypothetical protein Cob_v000843 [Colletotrichum orbiculare MAFF 240422]|uniref:Uncharacterized protein n=1 Tax=Colletotrichum orbiculare (strain 104-T / ATCC 96160 / CBS 514.97 / LARS 414 / MAFF 240422) TaxID=1213857 RepID=N4UXL4_COLOR|nr:hypothetical protein Cob_v000843 [Colletotrichum orbiculare MAFF 240422]